MSNKPIGPKKRRLDAVITDQPSLDEWIEFVQQPGPSGGWNATIADNPFDHGWKPQERNDPELTEELYTMPNIYSEIRKLRRGRAVPENSAPKEVFEIIAQSGVETIYYDETLHGTAL